MHVPVEQAPVGWLRSAMPSRRELLRCASAAALALAVGRERTHAQPRSSPQRLLSNHLGYLPGGAKLVMIAGKDDSSLRLRRRGVWPVDIVRPARAVGGDLGDYAVADFSDITEPGEYSISVDGGEAGPRFVIDTEIYSRPISAGVQYFRRQRCGHVVPGQPVACHLDDGRRSDDGRHHDATGGWHDACDLRKWVDATIYGVIALTRGLECLGEQHPSRLQAMDEIRWGNAYFHKLIDPAGFVMRWCAGDDGNHFTDNRVGTLDDRIVDVEPAEPVAQFAFVAAQSGVYRTFVQSDAQYARTCLDAATKTFEWCVKNRDPQLCLSLAAGVVAGVRLDVDREAQPSEAVIEYAKRLLTLQHRSAETEADGFFLAGGDSADAYRDPQHGNLPLLAFCELLEAYPTHGDSRRWRDALGRHCVFLTRMSRRSAFGTIPFGLYNDPNLNTARRVGKYSYRWFMKPGGEKADRDWWVGINAHLASNGVGLVRASNLLNDASLLHLGQRQLDWILGVNPFDASTISGFGREHPKLYRPGDFTPPTPEIAGGVMNGIGGDAEDRPSLLSGSWQTCEYWTPMVGYTHWLMAQLQAPTPSRG